MSIVKQKVIICQGIPASGKSTWAKELVAKDPTWKRINRDDLRAMIHAGAKWNKTLEKAITTARNELILTFLNCGYNLVIDDTNFGNTPDELMAVISEFKGDFEVEVKYFKVTLQEALRRNAERGRPVPDSVVKQFHRRYCQGKGEGVYREHDPGKMTVIAFDMDGTLAIPHSGRDPKISAETCHLDPPHEPIVALARVLHNQYPLIIVSGRHDTWKPQTVQWLTDHGFKPVDIFMRRAGDNRPDHVIKREIFDTQINPIYNLLFVVDDRNQVVEMWRSIGVPVLQCAEGDF